MPLLEMFQTNPAQIYALNIQQVVALCGDGRLRDNTTCSKELREYLSQALSEKIFEYLEACLQAGFESSGYVLQDLVNELGRRLDHRVENGLYQGRANTIGYDGIWRQPNEHAIVVEVKTTDAFSINLDTIARYRTELCQAGTITQKSSSLIVVGRQDTGGLEAQVRGSKHAWDIRIISVDALVKLVKLKEETEEETVTQIYALLVPFEYTRLDKIIDVAFTAAKDAGVVVQQETAPSVSVESGDDDMDGNQQQEHTPSEVLAAQRLRIVTAVGVREHAPLIRKSAALYWNAERNVRVVCSLSKRYPDGGYWYAYHSKWDKFLSEGGKGFYVLGCVGRDEAYALPFEWIHSKLDSLYTTERGNSKYWHVYLEEAPQDEMIFRHHQAGQRIPVTAFRVKLS